MSPRRSSTGAGPPIRTGPNGQVSLQRVGVNFSRAPLSVLVLFDFSQTFESLHVCVSCNVSVLHVDVWTSRHFVLVFLVDSEVPLNHSPFAGDPLNPP